MWCEFGLAIGDSFAEIVGSVGDSENSRVRSRWYLPKKPLSEGLREALSEAGRVAEANGNNSGSGSEKIKGRLRLSSRSVEGTLAKNQGKSPAVLVTSGFESWLTANQPVISPRFSLHAERQVLLSEEDFIFGVAERLSADGGVLSAPAISELEFLVAKLEMLRVKDVAVCFLHSRANPQNELVVSQFFKEKGFRVVTSHNCPGENEGARWRFAIECAYAESAIQEEREQLLRALEGDWQIEVWGHGGSFPVEAYTALNLRHGPDRVLQSTSQGSELFLGMDEFVVFGPSSSPQRAGLSPTQLIQRGLWPFPDLTLESCGYEPGPMLFGKSHQLSIIDVLFVRDRLRDIEGVSNLTSDRSKARILESLFTLGKSTSGKKERPPDAMAIAGDLERAFIEEINREMVFADIAANNSREVLLTGPLAESLAPLLKERRPDLSFRRDADLAWRQALACLSTGEKSTPGGHR